MKLLITDTQETDIASKTARSKDIQKGEQHEQS